MNIQDAYIAQIRAFARATVEAIDFSNAFGNASTCSSTKRMRDCYVSVLSETEKESPDLSKIKDIMASSIQPMPVFPKGGIDHNVSEGAEYLINNNSENENHE